MPHASRRPRRGTRHPIPMSRSMCGRLSIPAAHERLDVEKHRYAVDPVVCRELRAPACARRRDGAGCRHPARSRSAWTSYRAAVRRGGAAGDHADRQRRGLPGLRREAKRAALTALTPRRRTRSRPGRRSSRSSAICQHPGAVEGEPDPPLVARTTEVLPPWRSGPQSSARSEPSGAMTCTARSPEPVIRTTILRVVAGRQRSRPRPRRTSGRRRSRPSDPVALDLRPEGRRRRAAAGCAERSEAPTR